MDEYKNADFIQVEYCTIGPDGEKVVFWRNALFSHEDEKRNSYVIQYANGEKESISTNSTYKKIRKLKIEGGKND